MKSLSSKQLLLAAATLVLLTNLFIFVGILYNGLNPTVKHMVLSEREAIFYPSLKRQTENSGIAFNILWSMEHENLHLRTPPSWINEQKLLELGFRLDLYEKLFKRGYRPKTPVKEVYLVLELNGAAYQRALTQAKERLETVREQHDRAGISAQERPHEKEALQYLEYLQKRKSRLFVIDAGLDPAALAKRYADASVYLITKGTIRAFKPDYTSELEPIWKGTVQGLSAPLALSSS